MEKIRGEKLHQFKIGNGNKKDFLEKVLKIERSEIFSKKILLNFF